MEIPAWDAGDSTSGSAPDSPARTALLFACDPVPIPRKYAIRHELDSPHQLIIRQGILTWQGLMIGSMENAKTGEDVDSFGVAQLHHSWPGGEPPRSAARTDGIERSSSAICSETPRSGSRRANRSVRIAGLLQSFRRGRLRLPMRTSSPRSVRHQRVTAPNPRPRAWFR